MPIFSFFLVILFLFFHSVAGTFELFAYIRTDVFQGEYWRLFTSTLVHVNWEHVIRDSAAFLCFAPLVEIRIGTVRFLTYFALSSAFTSLSYLIFSPNVEILLGVSGVVSGYFGILLAQDLPRTWRNKSFTLFSIELIFLLGFVAKLGYEVFFQSSLLYRSELNPAPLAHFSGFVSGLCAGTLFKAKITQNLFPKKIVVLALAGATVWLAALLFWPKGL